MPTVRTNDVETYYEMRGDGPPVVFVHGALVDFAQWAPQLDALEDGYTVVAYDVRGHGRTGGSAREAYSIELFADDLAALVAALDLDHPVICGHSTGGCIAQLYAARHPDEPAGLVLADTFTPELSTPGERVQMALLRATIPPARLVGFERVEKLLVWLQERFQPGAGGEYEEIARLRAGAPTISTDEFAKVVRAVVAFRGTEIDYSAIAVPTLVLYGENEPSFVRRQAGLLEANLPDATVRMVPGAGHASNLDEPDFFTAAVRDLLARADFDREPG